MDDRMKAKLAAAGQIAFGAAKIGSGIVTATGHGIIGAMFKKHHHMHMAFRVAQLSIESGQKAIGNGLTDWKKASE